MRNKLFVTVKDSYNICKNGANKIIYYDDDISPTDKLILCNRCKIKKECDYFKANSFKSKLLRDVDKEIKKLIGVKLNKDELLTKAYGAYDGYLVYGEEPFLNHTWYLQNEPPYLYIYIVDLDNKYYKIYLEEQDDNLYLVKSAKRDENKTL